MKCFFSISRHAVRPVKFRLELGILVYGTGTTTAELVLPLDICPPISSKFLSQKTALDHVHASARVTTPALDSLLEVLSRFTASSNLMDICGS
jgi:hypothetical protein